ncbi:universal stress protein [Hymenobacter caeli]|uniref:Nucleotide-binding universal stress UspA family protein n=1 Tax=Hymenobacter caeli TaxID=2735894 RepID=A0ABX2FV38_9BACT|nr:universal stress protein [Hymenobacter caeli]NRT20194.1 nucleotide-binding universal stress UspA family protein [Hymenobacter caeli]
MQTILVPIDFTAASENALLYANKLALRLPAEIVLVHGGPGFAPAPERREALLRRLEAFAERLRYQQLTRQNGRRIAYFYHVAAEPLAASLQVLVAGYCADLVVTGLVLTDCAAATALGTPLGLLPEQVSCPVLVVPPGRHELASRIAVAGDFARLDGRQLTPLLAFGRALSPRFDLVQFYPPARAGLAPLKKALLSARAHLPGAAVHLLPEEDPLEGIGEFCAQQATQLLVLATADGCLVRRFFNPHYLKTNAYHLRIPVLLLPTSTLPTEACCASCSLRQAAEARLLAQPSAATA